MKHRLRGLSFDGSVLSCMGYPEEQYVFFFALIQSTTGIL
jgi:hypothetical protein